MSTNLTVVIKSSKLCNLRCKYCYEYESLSDKKKIPLDSYKTLFSKLKNISDEMGANIKFCWHGGEPLLLPKSYYEQALAIRDEQFGEKRVDIIQSNLFHVGGPQIETLELFRYISISYDAFSDDRVTLSGTNSASQVMDNMDTLRIRGKKFGVINVLTKANLSKLSEIFWFFNLAGLTVRILPFYRSSASVQTETFGLTSSEIRDAFLRLIDLYFQHGQNCRIYPIDFFIECAIQYLGSSSNRYKFDRFRREHVLMIDVNGDVYASGTAYDEHFRYGNIMRDNEKSILAGDGRQNMIKRSQQLVKQACSDCPYYGQGCSGFYIAEQTDIELAANDTGQKCPIIRACIDRAVEWVQLVYDNTAPEKQVGAYA